MAVVDRDVLDPIFTPQGLLGYLERIQVGMPPRQCLAPLTDLSLRL